MVGELERRINDIIDESIDHISESTREDILEVLAQAKEDAPKITLSSGKHIFEDGTVSYSWSAKEWHEWFVRYFVEGK